MLHKLYNELSRVVWKYHRLEMKEGDEITLKAISLDPDGISEVMRIKEIVDRYFLYMNWDGEDIRIVRLQ